MCNLIFSFLSLVFSCSEKRNAITLLWTNERATGIALSKNLTGAIYDSVEQKLVVRLITESKPVAILGHYKIGSDEIIFEPLIPFTRGLRYEVLLNNLRIEQIKIPGQTAEEAPTLLAIYPTSDTVPENLLKIYLQFSKPMREGQSLQHIMILKNNRDTVPGVFLDLQPELWNPERTMLTVWLDPGRIKRDLKPNKLLGAPLQERQRYTLQISDQWKDTQGSSLTTTYSKNFIVTSRDSLSPDPKTWRIQSPEAGTIHALHIDFNSSLDYSLLNTTLHIIDPKEKMVLGSWLITNQERKGSFAPDAPWMAGNYILQIESRLEDLAGNNLNRAFDVDVRSKTKQSSLGSIVSVPFFVKN